MHICVCVSSECLKKFFKILTFTHFRQAGDCVRNPLINFSFEALSVSSGTRQVHNCRKVSWTIFLFGIGLYFYCKETNVRTWINMLLIFLNVLDTIIYHFELLLAGILVLVLTFLNPSAKIKSISSEIAKLQQHMGRQYYERLL